MSLASVPLQFQFLQVPHAVDGVLFPIELVCARSYNICMAWTAILAINCLLDLPCISCRLLDALSDALNLQRSFFRDAFNAPMTFLRPLRYSATRSCPEQGVLGAGPHTDYGMLTLLLTDGTQGLQIQQADAWVDVETIAGGMVVNLGDMLERYAPSGSCALLMCQCCRM